jgi:hypothetical protein
MHRDSAVRRTAATALAIFALGAAPHAARAELWAEPRGRILMEVIGQVTNPSPASSLQYGYLSGLAGVAPAALFDGAGASEATALLTFANDSTTVRVTNIGPLRVVERTGIMTVYRRDAPGASFADPASFADGAPVMVADFRHQVVLDTTTGSFTTTFGCSVRASAPFLLDGRPRRIARVGARFRLIVYGKSNPAGPGQFVIAGTADE